MAVTLLTGAGGYIGSRLLRVLEEGGCAVRCMARRPERIAAGRATTEVVRGDCLDEASLLAAMHGVDQAYYLVHSMASGPGFAALDRQAAANFGRSAARAGVRRIVYLGGLGDDPDSLSTHLKSRLETGEALREAGVPVIEFRASIVIGAGSLSFEMIRALVERLPVMICPRWVDTSTQPIAIDDVLAYLRGALDLPDGRGAVFEIGGPEVVSYGDMMREYARLRGLRRLLLPVPVLTPRLSGMWLGLVTPAQARVGRALVEGLRNPTVVRSAAARETFEIKPMPLREAFMRAIEEGAGNQHKIDTRLVVVDAPPAQASTFTSVLMVAFALAAAVALHTTAAAVQTAVPPRTVPLVDLDRYAGDWFEIARLPNRFQLQCVGDVRASYARRADGRLDVLNQCRTDDGPIQARGIARVVDDRTFARLKVRFAPAWLTLLPFVWGDYWIIGLAEDYSWAVVGSPDREYLWILARTPRLDEESAAAARGVARANGFDVERLIQAAHEGLR